MAAISVVYTCGCTRCGTVNIKRQREHDQELFEKFASEDPQVYWKETLPTGVLYRQHEEDSQANCRTSC